MIQDVNIRGDGRWEGATGGLCTVFVDLYKSEIISKYSLLRKRPVKLKKLGPTEVWCLRMHMWGMKLERNIRKVRTARGQ